MNGSKVKERKKLFSVVDQQAAELCEAGWLGEAKRAIVCSPGKGGWIERRGKERDNHQGGWKGANEEEEDEGGKRDR